MIHMTLSQAAKILGITSPTPDTTFSGISIDTRTLAAGNLFVAIKGEHVDGHQFLAEAQKQGAAAALVTQKIDIDLPQLIVTDVIQALGQLATYWRQQFNLPIAAITGSNGKTTLKNMMASIMAAACGGDESKVLATQGTLNNHLGLPLTLARLNKQHRYAAIEMGMNHFGEIEYLTKLTRPQVAVITNAAAAHLEGVGDIAGVARAKAEIFLGLPNRGMAILNRDDAHYPYWREQIGQHDYLTFGFHPDADIRPESIEEALDLQLIHMQTPKGKLDIRLPLLGRHNVMNTLAATAISLAIGIPLTAVKTGLEQIRPAPGRMQLHTLPNGVKIINDTYNANPFSLQAAIQALANIPGKKILVLGDMKELGSNASDLHSEAGDKIRQAGIDYLFTFGELSANTAKTFGPGAYHFNEKDKLINALKPFLHNQTTILVKGSRSMKMEKVVESLL